MLGHILTEVGAISPETLSRALVESRRNGSRLGDILLSEGAIEAETLTWALARQYGLGVAPALSAEEAQSDELARRMRPEDALAFRAIPWTRIGNLTLVATARPDLMDGLRSTLGPTFGPTLFCVVDDRRLDDRLQQVHGQTLARQAETKVRSELSCRTWRADLGGQIIALCLALVMVMAFLHPALLVQIGTAGALLVMSANLGLRLAAAVTLYFGRTEAAPPPPDLPVALPVISILVPLHDEPEIAAPLADRLSRLDYPRDRLEICLVVEAGDRATLKALDRADLPTWMRVIRVPDGAPRTKPRAMNYALNFTRGQIIGIFDAEDAPAPGQLKIIAETFRSAPPKVACLQGRLDFYNPTRNWIARCFTIEYANWFRLILPGIAKLGLVVPLGGTTLFFRRTALDHVGGWDAHNVTEDADLGVRLARMGYETRIVRTTTLEEANASASAWIKQRSRWMKGYILTWVIHMRSPLRLWRDLGPRKFFGFNLLFVGSTLIPLLQPFLWSTVITIFGYGHPILVWLPGNGAIALMVILLMTTVISVALNLLGCAASHHRHLRVWVPTMGAYFPLASVAMAKALWEVVFEPFRWDKTEHGSFGGTETDDLSSLHARADGDRQAVAPVS